MVALCSIVVRELFCQLLVALTCDLFGIRDLWVNVLKCVVRVFLFVARIFMTSQNSNRMVWERNESEWRIVRSTQNTNTEEHKSQRHGHRVRSKFISIQHSRHINKQAILALFDRKCSLPHVLIFTRTCKQTTISTTTRPVCVPVRISNFHPWPGHTIRQSSRSLPCANDIPACGQTSSIAYNCPLCRYTQMRVFDVELEIMTRFPSTSCPLLHTRTHPSSSDTASVCVCVAFALAFAIVFVRLFANVFAIVSLELKFPQTQHIVAQQHVPVTLHHQTRLLLCLLCLRVHHRVCDSSVAKKLPLKLWLFVVCRDAISSQMRIFSAHSTQGQPAFELS